MFAPGFKIILIVTGGIAAYKSAHLVRLLSKAGCAVQVVMTENAEHFIGAATFQALSGRTVRGSLWDDAAEAAMSHIELARWADAIVIAPATANTLAKLAAGLSNDLASTLCLATKAPVYFAPAMNQLMWAHQATQANVRKLSECGYRNLGTGSGEQACGDVGPGRMLEPEAIVAALLVATSSMKALSGKRVLISAGPTQEDLDPVRFIGNRSSGKMGYALAQTARDLGADVTLISGPTRLDPPPSVRFISIRSAHDLLAQMQQYASDSDVIVAAAAVADYRPAMPSQQKIKKSTDTIELQLVKNPDVIATIAAELRAKSIKSLLVGFAAETNDVMANARSKRERKRLDWIAANQVSATLGMDADDNALILIGAEQELIWATRTSKRLRNASGMPYCPASSAKYSGVLS